MDSSSSSAPSRAYTRIMIEETAATTAGTRSLISPFAVRLSANPKVRAATEQVVGGQLSDVALLRNLLHSAGLPMHRRLGEAAPPLEDFVISPVPALWHGCESPLFSGRLEAQPPVGEFLGDRGAGAFSDTTPALQASPPFRSAGEIFIVYAAVDESTLCRRGMHPPYIPDSSLEILERCVSHRGSRAIVRSSMAAKFLPTHLCGRMWVI